VSIIAVNVVHIVEDGVCSWWDCLVMIASAQGLSYCMVLYLAIVYIGTWWKLGWRNLP